MSSHGYVNIRVEQSLPVHPLTHVQVLGAEHSLLVPHWELQIATYKICDIKIFWICQ